MAIQMRRGLEADFNPDKMKPGEWAVSLDSKYVRMCFSPGLCFRMATYESFEEDMQEIQNILTSVNSTKEAIDAIKLVIDEKATIVTEKTDQALQYADVATQKAQEATDASNSASESATNANAYATSARESADMASTKATESSQSASNANASSESASNSAATATLKANDANTSATNARNSADNAQSNATLSESYAKGGTGSREGEDTDNAKYYAEQAKKTDVGVLSDVVNEIKSDIVLYEQRGFLRKNLLNPTFHTKTANGVTCTNNGDGTYTLNGTSVQNNFFDLINTENFPMLENGKKYKLVGCPAGGSENSYMLKGRNAGGTYDIGNGYKFTYDESITDYKVTIRIEANTVCDNLIFKPMLTTDLSETYDDFTPYAPSNTELQSAKTDNSVVSDAWNSTTTYSVGQYCIYNNSLWKCLVQHNGQTPTEGTYWTKLSIASELQALWNAIA